MKKEEHSYDYMKRLSSWNLSVGGIGGAELAKQRARKAIEGKTLKECIMILVKASKQYAHDAEVDYAHHEREYYYNDDYGHFKCPDNGKNELEFWQSTQELVVAAEIVEKAHLWCLRAENYNRKLVEFVNKLADQSEEGDWLPPASTWGEDCQPDFNKCYSHLAEICHEAKKLKENEDETN